MRTLDKVYCEFIERNVEKNLDDLDEDVFFDEI